MRNTLLHTCLDICAQYGTPFSLETNLYQTLSEKYASPTCLRLDFAKSAANALWLTIELWFTNGAYHPKRTIVQTVIHLFNRYVTGFPLGSQHWSHQAHG